MEKINKEYPILSNWKFVFKEMYDLDHKYPWYIAVRSAAGFLAPFIAAIIPSAAISMVEKKADFLTFFGVMLAFVLGNMIMGIVSTKYDFLIKKKNYKNIQINKVKEIFQNKEDKNMQTRKGRHEISWWNRILFHRIDQ